MSGLNYSLPGIYFLLHSSLLLILTPAATLAYAAENTLQRVYPVPEHGELILNVPANWEVTYFLPAETRPPVITFYKKDKTAGELFQLNISPLWDDGFERDITSPENIRALVESVGENLLAISDETELLLKPVEGLSGKGYLFNLTDSSAGPGEYRHLTQGAINIGEILLVFSLFTHDQDPLLQEKTLKMIQTAIHRFQRHI